MSKIMVADFETTVYDGQDSTEVWAVSSDYVYDDDYRLFHSLPEYFEYIFKLNDNLIIYFHNLKFDGNFMVYDLLKRLDFKFTPKLIMYKHPTKFFTTLISDKNRWYNLTLSYNKHKIEFRDSAKLMPYTLEQVGEAFQTEHRKLKMEYKGFRYPGCDISLSEQLYIRNDVLVLKEAMRHMLDAGFNRLTIGSCCLNEFKELFKQSNVCELEYIFPNLKDISCEILGFRNWDEYIRKTYKGAWCYCKEGEAIDGNTYDINSLYPFVMHSSSRNYYPVGMPHVFYDSIPEKCNNVDVVYFVRIKCKFKLKENMLPTIQIKDSFLYKSNEWLTTSDIKYRGKYYEYFELDGKIYDNKPILNLTKADYELFLKHYNVWDLEILDGCWFNAEMGLFDNYIDKWNFKKENAKNKVERTQAKLMNNNLYGKLSTDDNSTYLEPQLIDDVVHYIPREEHNKKVFSISCGSFVTSYARCYTITHAQLNYKIFRYADTDSLHLSGIGIGLEIHPTKLGAWKHETHWRRGKFLRQKCYCEFVDIKDDKKIYPHWEITCAGMSERAKNNFLAQHPITDFKYELTIPGNLKPKVIKGGVLLVEYPFTLRKSR